MLRPTRTQRLNERAAERVEIAQRAALTRAIGVLTSARQLPAAEILRRMLAEEIKDGGKDGGQP